MVWKPDDLGIWLSDVDVNGLSDTEADVLAQFDPASDAGLDEIAKNWARPRFEEHDAQNRNEMLAILSKAREWDEKQLKPVFAQFGFPGADMDFARYIAALQRHFLV